MLFMKDSNAKQDILHALSYVFSLSPLEYKRIITLAINSIVLLVFLLIYFLTDSNAAILVLGLIYSMHIMGIWTFFIIDLIDPKRIRKLTLIRLVFIFVLTVILWTVLHSVLLQFIPDVYEGIPPTSTKIQFLGFATFLSIETIVSLGSGAIFASSDHAWGYLLIALNTIHGLTFITFGVAKVLTIISEKRQSNKKKSKAFSKRK